MKKPRELTVNPPPGGALPSAEGSLKGSVLPPGVRDLLPGQAERRRGVVSAIAQELDRWGYRPIVTPIYEYDEVLRRGLGGPARALRLVEPSTGEVLALRPDLTAQVARLVATRLHDEPGPLRLRYEGSVVRIPGTGGQGELYQVGVELVDAPQPGGDLEIVSLAEAALGAAGLDGLHVDLGHADVARTALEGLGLDEDTERALHAALAKKDQAEVAAIARQTKVSARQKKLLAELPGLYGGPEVVARARGLVEKRSPAARALDELELLLERLAALGVRAKRSVDLGEVRGFGYYTGIRLAVYAAGVGGALASGGRYDRLVERYGRPARATGFAVDVDRVAELLDGRGAEPERGGLLVGGEPVQAARLAQRLRARGLRTVLDLDDPPQPDPVLKARARRARLERVILAGERRLRWFDVEPPGARGSLEGAALKELLTGARHAALDVLLPAR